VTSDIKLGKLRAFLILFFILLIPTALSYDECQEYQSLDKIPCIILLPSATNCTLISVSFYNQSTLLDTQTMFQYSPVICSANFTYNATGTYNFNYSTGDSGAITVEEGNAMIYLLYFGLVLIALLMILGLYMQNQPVLAIDGFLMLVVGVWIFIYGFSIYNNMVTQMLGTVIFALGGYFLTMATLSMIESD